MSEALRSILARLLPGRGCLTMLLALGTASLLGQEDERAATADDAQAAADLELVSALDRVVARAIARAERSVVSIARRKRAAQEFAADTRSPRIHLGSGGADHGTPFDADFAANEFASGVVIDARGLILTNRHVLGDDPQQSDFFVTTIDRRVFAARLKGGERKKSYPMSVKASDGMSDLAVLEPLEQDSVRTGDFIPIPFGDAATLRKGQHVIALGNPYGIARDGQASASLGIVANLSRKAVTASDDDGLKSLHDYGTLIQTDAKLNLGTSGGALINLRGEMIGLTTSLAAAAGFEQPAGYAIPIDAAILRVIQALREGREVEYGLLGIQPGNLPRDQMQRGQPGVMVNGVVRGGPAWKANISDRDIITHVDDQVIYDEDGLRLHISKLAPGASTALTVLSPKSTRPIQRRVVVGKLPVNLPQTYTTRGSDWRGAVVDWRMPRAAVALQTIEDFSTPCVRVREVNAESPAWQAGLREGMLISHVGTTPVATPADFHQAVAAQQGPVKLRLLSGADASESSITIPGE